ncbi:MAG: glycerol-3-phosphate 1-O-acyltransferase PlsY [Blastocatellia bacterium]|nr:glycerol-3-phosphate 1-O-acyltransferase PlsY [Blastocatellia bacterium]
MFKSLFIVALAYLLGSIPFGYLIVRASKRADIRETGSGGTGATNVSRRAGKAAGVLTLVLDASKGAAAVAIAKGVLGLPVFAAEGGLALNQLANSNWAIESAYWCVAAAAIAALVGHIFPIWLGFRGGKGVATGVGVFLVLSPFAVVIAGVVFLVIVLLTRYVSLGSIVAAVTIPLLVLIQNYITPRIDCGPLITAAILSAALIVFAHRQNISRLLNGTESKFK